MNAPLYVVVLKIFFLSASTGVRRFDYVIKGYFSSDSLIFGFLFIDHALS